MNPRNRATRSSPSPKQKGDGSHQKIGNYHQEASRAFYKTLRRISLNVEESSAGFMHKEADGVATRRIFSRKPRNIPLGPLVYKSAAGSWGCFEFRKKDPAVAAAGR